MTIYWTGIHTIFYNHVMGKHHQEHNTNICMTLAWQELDTSNMCQILKNQNFACQHFVSFQKILKIVWTAHGAMLCLQIHRKIFVIYER